MTSRKYSALMGIGMASGPAAVARGVRNTKQFSPAGLKRARASDSWQTK